jgi:hypothetical protein
VESWDWGNIVDRRQEKSLMKSSASLQVLKTRNKEIERGGPGRLQKGGKQNEEGTSAFGDWWARWGGGNEGLSLGEVGATIVEWNFECANVWRGKRAMALTLD